MLISMLFVYWADAKIKVETCFGINRTSLNESMHTQSPLLRPMDLKPAHSFFVIVRA